MADLFTGENKGMLMKELKKLLPKEIDDMKLILDVYTSQEELDKIKNGIKLFTGLKKAPGITAVHVQELLRSVGRDDIIETLKSERVFVPIEAGKHLD